MLRSIIVQLLLWQFLIAFVNCDYLTVYTRSGPIKGVPQKTFVNRKYYISYKGIPFAQPPIGRLRFREPVPVKPWRKIMVTTNEYANACNKLAQMNLLPITNLTYSEDCLYLNVFTPVLHRYKKPAKLTVIFFIHGGAFSVDDASDRYYGPDFLMEENVVLVTVNYRLGPWGGANFDKCGYTGNMGFKDQRLALKWVKQNIIYFGGNPNDITIMGQSAGATSVHLHILGASCKYIKRAIMLSGCAFNYWAHYKKNNHYELFRTIFKDELGDQNSNEDVFNFVMNAPTDVLVEKVPSFDLPNGMFELLWGVVIEDERKANDPILTRRPHEIYVTNSLCHRCKDIEVLIGFTSAEWGIVSDPTNLYGWIDGVQNHSLIGLPYHGLRLTPADEKYQKWQSNIHDYYFGKKEINESPKRLNQFIQMESDIHIVVPFYEFIKLHSKVSPTFCYLFDVNLATNIVKTPRQLKLIEGAIHVEDIGYIFKTEEFAEMYDQTLDNRRHNCRNQQTIYAWRFVPRFFTDFAKFGTLENVKSIKSVKHGRCVHITNNGLSVIAVPRKKVMEELWNEVRRSVRSRIVDEF